MKRRTRFLQKREGVSPVIGVIITVVIVVVITSIALVWFTSLTSETDKKVIKPINITPELNIERIKDELVLSIIIGNNIDWSNYRVMLNNSEVKTETGIISTEGDDVFFDYKGGKLQKGLNYQLDIIQIDANMVVFSKSVFALSYAPEGPGCYGYITVKHVGDPVYNAEISLYQNDILINSTLSDISGAYELSCGEGTFDIICEVYPSPTQFSFNEFIESIQIGKYGKIRFDIELDSIHSLNSTLNGHIYDNVTKNVIPNIEFIITDYDDIFIIVYTDSNGYYDIPLPTENVTIFCSVKGYYIYNATIILMENKTTTVDFYLHRIPPQSGMIHGFIYDKKTDAILANVKIITNSDYMSNNTYSNDTGYYDINVVPGNITLSVSLEGYNNWEKTITVVNEEKYLLNIYL